MIGSGDRLCQLSYKMFGGWVGTAGRYVEQATQSDRVIAAGLHAISACHHSRHML